MRIAFTGGRSYNDKDRVNYVLSYLTKQYGYNYTVVVGDASGLDNLIRWAAYDRQLSLYIYYANWLQYGKAAGPRRNKEMLDSGVDLLIAFPGGKGTANCIKYAKNLDIPILYAEEL